MYDLWPPRFKAHEDWDSDFPGIGYPDYAKQALVEGHWDSDASLEENPSALSKSLTILGPRVYHFTVLLGSKKSNKNESLKQLNNDFKKQTPTENKLLKHVKDDSKKQPSTETKLLKHVKYDSKKQPSTENKLLKHVKDDSKEQQFSSLPSTSFNNVSKSVQPHSLTQKPPVVGGFKTPMRVNAPVSLEEKQNQIRKNQKQKPDPKVQISKILTKMEDLKSKIEEYTGTSNTERNYKFLDEMLTRLFLELDDIETDSHPELRQERKEAVRKIHSCIARLEERLAENQANQTGGGAS